MDPAGLLIKLLRVIAVCGGVYGLVAAFLYFYQGNLIFLATRGIDRTPALFGWNFDELLLDVDGFKSHAWYIPLENHRGVALFSHGNAGNISDRLESIQLLRSFGFSVLAYDYGGYGISTGTPSERRCYADIQAMWDYLVETRGVEEQDILLFGRSLGAAPTAHLAQSIRPGAVILESAFLSIPDMARENLVFRSMTWLIRHRFDNRSKVPAITSPLLFVHSPDDEIIPYEHGQKLYELAMPPKTFVEIRGTHNIGFVESEKLYRLGWETFLTPIFGSNRV